VTVYTCGRFGLGSERAVFVLGIECFQMPGVEKKCALSRRLWVVSVTVDTSTFEISKGARNGEGRLAVGVTRWTPRLQNACPWGWIKTDTWRRPSSWPCLTTSPPFLFISAIFHAGLFSPDANPFFLGTCRPLQFGFTSLKSHQLPESKSARARADHQGLFRLRSPHGHVISSYQPQAIPLMTQARLYTLAKHR
jgi:hypothetical protein